MTRLLIILGILATSFSLQANAMNVWLGLAGAGGGAGSFGHTSLVFSSSSYAFGKVVSYTVGSTHEESKLRTYTGMITGLPSLKMSISEIEFNEYKFIYGIAENRKISLFKLRLTDNEIRNLQKLIEDDKYKQEQGSSELEYVLTSSNCITRIIDLINLTVSKERQIPITSFTDSLQPSFQSPEKVAANFLNRIPVWIGKFIPRSSIYGGETIEIEDFNSSRINSTKERLKTLFTKIKVCNNVSNNMISAMEEMTLFSQKNPSYFDSYKFDTYFKKLKECDEQKTFYRSFLLILNDGINPHDIEYRQKINKLIEAEK